jgi:hypothetical protein
MKIQFDNTEQYLFKILPPFLEDCSNGCQNYEVIYDYVTRNVYVDIVGTRFTCPIKFKEYLKRLYKLKAFL